MNREPFGTTSAKLLAWIGIAFTLAWIMTAVKSHGQASQFYSYHATATNYTTKLTDFYIAGTATLTNTLPLASTTRKGQGFAVKEVVGTNVVTVRMTGSDTINGVARDDIVTVQRQTTYISDGVSNYQTLFAPSPSDTCIETLSGTTPTIRFAGCKFKKWTLSGDSTPTIEAISGDAPPSIELMIIQPAGQNYVISGPSIDWQTTTDWSAFESDSTNYIVLQWNGEGTVGWNLNASTFQPGGLVGPLTPGYVPVASTTTNLTDSLIYQPDTNGAWINGSFAIGTDTNKFTRQGQNILYTSGSTSPLFTVYDGLGDNLSFLSTTVVSSQNNAIGAAVPASKGFLANNTFIATSGLQQNSPGVIWQGNGYGTNTTSSQNVDFISYLVPSAGADTPTSTWFLDSSASNGVPVTSLSVAANSGWTGAGTLFLSDDGTFKVAGGPSPFVIVGSTVYLDPAYDTLAITNLVTLSPFAGEEAVPFIFNTSVTHITDDLFEVGNNGNTKFAVDYVGNTVLGGTLTTATPSVEGAGDMRFGQILACSAVTVIATNVWQISIGGVTNNVLIGTVTP